ncbi:hypothetical protein AOQ84DRAFT_392152 [Glonium stellatum]|uniref:Uncharacterized protein n=1 Tax=Glonium stellatum TaxID=574774 RepID=A0A8E2ERQ5_9PEZI|nr:hypothetical protein AOQ84DRAFT_392152 [Glonium stellatum]
MEAPQLPFTCNSVGDEAHAWLEQRAVDPERSFINEGLRSINNCSLAVLSTLHTAKIATTISLKKMIRVLAVSIVLILGFILPTQALPKDPSVADRDTNPKNNYRTVTYCINKNLKGGCETQEILLSNPLPLGVPNEGYELGGECKNMSVEFVNLVSSIRLTPTHYPYWCRFYRESDCFMGSDDLTVTVVSNGDQKKAMNLGKEPNRPLNDRTMSFRCFQLSEVNGPTD